MRIHACASDLSSRLFAWVVWGKEWVGEGRGGPVDKIPDVYAFLRFDCFLARCQLPIACPCRIPVFFILQTQTSTRWCAVELLFGQRYVLLNNGRPLKCFQTTENEVRDIYTDYEKTWVTRAEMLVSFT